MTSMPGSMPPDVTRGPAINAVAWSGFGISLVFVIARMYTRIRLLRTPGWDDWIIVFSTVLNAVFCALSSAAVAVGLGRHVAYVGAYGQSRILYLAAILQPIGIGAYCVPKLAVVVLLIKLMGPKKKGLWYLYGIIVVLFISSALSIIFIFAQCDPPSHFWKPEEPAKCISPLVLQRITLFAGSWSAFVDLSLAIFPLSIFWDLQMPLKRKISISMIMGLGVVATVCAVIKTTHLPEEQNPDFTWAFYDLLIWTFIEADVVIICACAPLLPRLLTSFREKTGASTAGKWPAGSFKRGESGHMRPNNSSYKVFDSHHDNVSTTTAEQRLAVDPEEELHEISHGNGKPYSRDERDGVYRSEA